MTWLIMAIFSALFAGLISVLAKCEKKTDSDIATAIRTIVVLLFSLIMVLIVGSLNNITNISLTSFIFLIFWALQRALRGFAITTQYKTAL